MCVACGCHGLNPGLGKESPTYIEILGPTKCAIMLPKHLEALFLTCEPAPLVHWRAFSGTGQLSQLKRLLCMCYVCMDKEMRPNPSCRLREDRSS